MPDPKYVKVKQLAIDLENFRTVRQDSELSAVQAMISTSPDRFWALFESILEDGYLPTETILVLESRGSNGALVVKEGNRRVAAVKLIGGLLKLPVESVPNSLLERMASVPDRWLSENEELPCVVYPWRERDTVDRIVTLTHGKGEKAGRDQWNAVARARHNRDKTGASEPALDLLERYLKHGRNLSPAQAGRWAGDYRLTVLEEAIKRLAKRLGKSTAREVADAYPTIDHRLALEELIRDVGIEVVSFKTIRAESRDFATGYGIPPEVNDQAQNETDDEVQRSGDGGDGKSDGGNRNERDRERPSAPSKKKPKPEARSISDPRAVKNAIRSFTPRGPGREKVATLRDELKSLHLKNNPLAFCFLLRSAFEISAKAYCDDHAASGGPSVTTRNGKHRPLVALLEDITKHLTGDRKDTEMLKRLHGAMTELARNDGLLSVTSMNQLVHSPSFSVTTRDICTLFGNVLPLLEAMNE